MTACHTKSADKLNKTCQSPSDQGIDLLFKNSLVDICAADIELSAKQTGVLIPWSEPAEVSILHPYFLVILGTTAAVISLQMH